jgi:hypothetical protein
MVSILTLVCLSAPDKYLCMNDGFDYNPIHGRAALPVQSAGGIHYTSTFLGFAKFTFKEYLVLLLVNTLWYVLSSRPRCPFIYKRDI